MAKVPHFQLSGSPYEIGLQHGQLAATQIQSSLELYRKYFKEQAKLEWDTQVRELAKEFAGHIERDYSELYEEMKGVAEGANVDVLDIVALNARSEIGLASPNPDIQPIDGCTAFSCRDEQGIYWSGQNWDWKSAASSSLISLDILAHAPTKRPRIKMMTEAGVIGKIGVNSHGISVMLNALKTDLRNPSYIPIHLLLRLLVQQPSFESCLTLLTSPPISSRCASAAHILLTSPTSSISLEILPTGLFTRPFKDNERFLTHTNHLLHVKEATETHLWPDSFPRLSTLSTLLEKQQELGFETFKTVLSDRSLGEKGICRHEEGDGIVTVFQIAVRNGGKEGDVRAEIVVGKPDEGGEKIVFDFDE